MEEKKPSNLFQVVFVVVVTGLVFYAVYDSLSKKSNSSLEEIGHEERMSEVKEDSVLAVEPENNLNSQDITLQDLERRQWMAQYSSDQINNVNTNYKSFIQSGGVKVDFKNKSAQIDPPLWYGLDMDGKKTVMQIIQLKYGFENLKMPDSFTYYNMKTGTRLASYSSWSDFTFY